MNFKTFYDLFELLLIYAKILHNYSVLYMHFIILLDGVMHTDQVHVCTAIKEQELLM